ncbi:MAG: thymidylate kinase, partial [Sphingomonadaceae bacterium]|nr:thymidylate kinase [Sphingomonadaceae bacterium]
TLLIEVCPQEAANRAAARDAGTHDRIGGRKPAYHARVAEAFERIANAESERFTRIDGNGAVEEIHDSILSALSPLLEPQS